MAHNDFVQAAFDRFDIYLAYQSQSQGTIVGGALWFDLMEKPKTLLPKGQRWLGLVRTFRDSPRPDLAPQAIAEE